jgi:hypothetical protein
MRSHVTFKTPRFNQTEVQPHFINPCCFGEDCIFWLIAELRGRGWADHMLPRLAPALHQVLRAAPDISDICWHLEDVFRRGGSQGAADPSAPRSAGETA